MEYFVFTYENKTFMFPRQAVFIEQNEILTNSGEIEGYRILFYKLSSGKKIGSIHEYSMWMISDIEDFTKLHTEIRLAECYL